MFGKVKSTTKRLHKNQKGDIPVGTILMIGAIVIPLIIVLTVYGEKLKTWFDGESSAIIDSSSQHQGITKP